MNTQESTVRLDSPTNLFIIEVMEGGDWDSYPDPVRLDFQQTQAKVDYLIQGFPNLPPRPIRIREITQAEREQHDQQFLAWLALQD